MLAKINDLLSSAKEEYKRSLIKQLRKNIGQLRQWLNEDRITENNKQVTSQMINKWLLEELNENT